MDAGEQFGEWMLRKEPSSPHTVRGESDEVTLDPAGPFVHTWLRHWSSLQEGLGLA